MVLHFSLTCFVNSQDPNAIEHQEGPSGDLYAMPQKPKKNKGKEEDSVPDKKRQKKSGGVSKGAPA